MRFEVLGPMRISANGRAAVLTGRHRTLLAALLVARGQPMSTQRLSAELWPHGAPATAGAALQVYISGLRKTVGGRLQTTPGGYLLDVAGTEVDAYRFEALLASAGDRQAVLSEALALWRGPAFDGVPAGPTIAAEATRLVELLLAARQEWADLALAAGRQAELLVDLPGWVAEHPTSERLAGQLMLALHRCGRTGEAVVVYSRVEAAVAQLGARPGRELTSLVEAIRRHDPTLDPADPALPASRNRFIGRRTELDRAIELLGTSRLLTIVGSGGCGKTRMSYELAREMAADHPDGVSVVELASHETGKGQQALTARVAAAVGAREVPGQPVAVSLARHLGTHRMLLLMDNCEHVRAEAAALVHALLDACPAVRVVATSREPLSLPGEVVFPLAGLAVPAPDATPAQIARCDAVRLLADRVTSARGGTPLRPDEIAVAAELCRRLDGLPLALELAAGRLRALSLSEIAARLDRRLELLVGVSPVQRHQTMRATIDWGHELLDEPQRLLLRRLSVFAGDFNLDAAQQVGADPSGPAPRTADDVLGPLTQLVERSLVERATAVGDSSRYRLIETVREYARERLAHDGATGEGETACERHASVWIDLLAASPPVDGPAHARWLATVGAEHDNIRAALAWTLDKGDSTQGLTIATAMWWYWWITGQMVEGCAWLARALQVVPAQPTALRGRALRAAAALSRNSGDLAEARRLGEEALSTFRHLGDQTGIVAALNNLSITVQGQGDFEASLAYGYEGLRMAEMDGSPRAIVAALNNTAGTLRCLDRLDEAAAMFVRALDGFRAIGDRRGQAAALSNLSIVDRRQGRLSQARAQMIGALRLYTELDIAEGQLDAVEGLAQLDILEGHAGAGLRLLAIAERERSALGAPIFTPDEIIDRDQAEQSARAALTAAQVADAYRSATATPLPAAVAGLVGSTEVRQDRPSP